MSRFQGPVYEGVPEGDNRTRLVCRDCGFINYVNPKVVVGAVCLWERRVLLCRRAIDPGKGYWTIPAGYLELHETAEQGAKREVLEEAGAHVEVEGLLAVYTLTHLSQIQLIYRAQLKNPGLRPGPESAEANLVDWSDIPWDELAFPSIHWALHDHRRVCDETEFIPATNPSNFKTQ